MFCVLEEDVIELLEGGNQKVADFIDFTLTAHRMGHIILALNRRDLLRLAQADGLSNLSRRMLSFISNRANDYNSAMRGAGRIIRICTKSKTYSFLFDGRDVYVNYGVLNIVHSLTQKFLLGEGFRDVAMIDMLSRIYLRKIGYPDSYISFRPLAGGGDALCQVLGAEHISPVKGIVLCDADTHVAVPPFPSQSTADKALAKATELNLLSGAIGVSEVSPFFAFLITQGRTMENMVRPQALEMFFSANQQSRAERADFVAAFPSFPALSDVERMLWISLNLKDKTPSIAAQLNLVRKTEGKVPVAIAGRTAEYSRLSLPRNVIDWLTQNWSGTQHARGIQRAISADLEDTFYETAVREWAIALASMSAGDTAAART